MDAGMTFPAPFPGSRQRGFTLIELMIVVTLLAVMLGIGIPSFRGFIAGQRVKTAAYDFATALLVARSEAIKRNTTVTIAPTGSWIGGWTVAAGGTTIWPRSRRLSNVTSPPTRTRPPASCTRATAASPPRSRSSSAAPGPTRCAACPST
jgi:type IV fimbrial biogenesis protein FimT